jgi:hypothetical protein
MRLIHPDGKPEWVWCDGWDGKNFIFRRGDKKTSTFTIDKTQIKKYSVDVKFPFGYFNTKKSTIFCQRSGARQNSKGLANGASIQYHTMESIIIHSGIMSGVQSRAVLRGIELSSNESRLNPELVNASLEEPKYFSLSDALVQIRSRKVFSRALSPHFAVVPHHANKEYLMFFHESPVAEIVSKTNKIKVLAESLRPEITSLFEPQGATILP